MFTLQWNNFLVNPGQAQGREPKDRGRLCDGHGSWRGIKWYTTPMGQSISEFIEADDKENGDD